MTKRYDPLSTSFFSKFFFPSQEIATTLNISSALVGCVLRKFNCGRCVTESHENIYFSVLYILYIVCRD